MKRPVLLAALVLQFAALLTAAPAGPHVPAAAIPSPFFNTQRATDAWLATVPALERAKSDAYFEGGYWLILWDFLSLAFVMLLLLETNLSCRMRDLAARMTRKPWLLAYLYWIQFAIVTSLLLFPFTVYEEFFREHTYGLSNQTFPAWLRDSLVGFALALVLGGAVVATIVELVRRRPRSWHMWAVVVSMVFLVFGAAVAPVFITPLFNTYTPLKDARLKQQILSLAHANGIPAHDVYQVDASRQSTRVSANVSGLFGTDRITLNDNLLSRCSPQAVLSTMGHEMGHYVMHHVLNGVLFSGVILLAMFSALRWSLDCSLTEWASRWGVQGIGDVAALPLAVLLLSTMSFVFTPLGNTYTRTQEYEADLFGLNAARQPDGEAEVDLLLGEYRKLDPTPLEEFIFFDHPSGRTRIYAAMRWKAQNLCLFDSRLPCTNPPDSLPKSLPSAQSGRR